MNHKIECKSLDPKIAIEIADRQIFDDRDNTSCIQYNLGSWGLTTILLLYTAIKAYIPAGLVLLY